MKPTSEQLDILTELINIGVGQAAGTLNEMIEFPIQLRVPFIKILPMVELENQLVENFQQDSLSVVQLNFQESFIGNANLIFPKESAVTLVSLLTDEKPESSKLNLLKIGTLTEVGNILLNNVIGSISNILQTPMRYLLPFYTEGNIDTIVLSKETKSNSPVILATTCFEVKELEIKGDIILIFQVDSFKNLLSALEELE
ncbi:MAG: chemotaxis protein CheC [Prochloraceae cyanobacterium]|nr:chemotaxis protein CheC [Prochloraceae cyanobacterium]